MKRLTTEDFIKKAKLIHGNKYDYSLVDYKNSITKIKIICPDHGEFLQTPNNHISGKKGCPICAGNIQSTTEDFIEKAKLIHGDKYDYSLVDYKKSNSSIKIICPTHGEFEQTPANHLQGQQCPSCYGNITLTTEDFIEKAKQIHGDKYDYSLVDYKNNRTSVKILCPIHGEFEQNLKNHITLGQGCPCCKGDKIAKSKTFIDKSYLLKKFKLIHKGYYDYSKFVFHGRRSKTKSIIICPIHGEFEQNPFNHLNGQGCPSCGVRYSQHEEYIEQYLKNNNIRYIRGDRSQIHPLELDFYMPDYNVAIEVNGTYWHSDLMGKNRKYHLNKTNLCKDKGIRLIHINEYEFVNTPKIIMSKLNSIFGKTKYRLFARKCKILEIDSKTKGKFLSKYHIQGNDKSNVKLGLFYKTRLVSVMTFSKYRLGIGTPDKSDGEFELSRFCNNSNFYVVGGASKLLKYFERNYTPNTVKTYADKRWSQGDVYYKLGFTHKHDSKPNYWYFNKSNMFKIYHRFGFRKDQLPTKLKTFDINVSEWENMKNNGWNRIWDCGTMVFEKKY